MNTTDTIHELKTWPEYFDDIESGRKTFEVRKLDRLFGVGHTLHLKEWSPIKGYSGRETKKVISYMMIGGKWGLLEGNCILGLQPASQSPAAGVGWIDDLKKFIKEQKDIVYQEYILSPEDRMRKMIIDRVEKIISNPASPQEQGQAAEVERLKGLIEKAFKECYNLGRVHPGNNKNKDWEQFKSENNL